MKNYLNCFKTIFFVFINFSKNFHEYIRMENSELQNSLKLLKNHLICFKYNIFCFEKFFKKFVNI